MHQRTVYLDIRGGLLCRNLVAPSRSQCFLHLLLVFQMGVLCPPMIWNHDARISCRNPQSTVIPSSSHHYLFRRIPSNIGCCKCSEFWHQTSSYAPASAFLRWSSQAGEIVQFCDLALQTFRQCCLLGRI